MLSRLLSPREEFAVMFLGLMLIGLVVLVLVSEQFVPKLIADPIPVRLIDSGFADPPHPSCYMFPDQKYKYKPCRQRWGLP